MNCYHHISDLQDIQSGARIIPVRKSLLLTESGYFGMALRCTYHRKEFFSDCLLQVTSLILMRNYKEPIRKLSDAQSVAFKSINSSFRKKI